MAARLNRRQTESTLAKIQVGNVITKLQKHLNGEQELSQTQIAAARLLLDRTLPCVKPVDPDTGSAEDRLNITVASFGRPDPQ